MSTQNSDVAHIPVDRLTLLQMIHKAKQKQEDQDEERREQKDAYVASVLKSLERITHSITGEDVWEASAPDGTITIVIPASVEKPAVREDWKRLEKIYSLDVREQVLVPTKLLNLLIEVTENE